MSLLQLIHSSQISDRLSELLESIATPTDLVTESAPGLTRWQTIRVEKLDETWVVGKEATAFFSLLDSCAKRLSLDQDTQLNNALREIFWGTEGCFYLEGFTTGQHMATVSSAARSSIASAMAGLADPRWQANVVFGPGDDLWEVGAWQAAQNRYDALPPAYLVADIQQWNRLLDKMDSDIPAAAKELEALRDDFVTCGQNLRWYFFHEGVRDGRAIGNVGGAA